MNGQILHDGRPMANLPSGQDAITEATQQATLHEPAQLVVHDGDGQVE